MGTRVKKKSIALEKDRVHDTIFLPEFSIDSPLPVKTTDYRVSKLELANFLNTSVRMVFSAQLAMGVDARPPPFILVSRLEPATFLNTSVRMVFATKLAEGGGSLSIATPYT
jgi:hypothetical protein